MPRFFSYPNTLLTHTKCQSSLSFGYKLDGATSTRIHTQDGQNKSTHSSGKILLYPLCSSPWQAYAANPGHQATRHGLAGIAQRRADGILNPAEQSIREEILSGLLANKGGEQQ